MSTPSRPTYSWATEWAVSVQVGDRWVYVGHIADVGSGFMAQSSEDAWFETYKTRASAKRALVRHWETTTGKEVVG